MSKGGGKWEEARREREKGERKGWRGEGYNKKSVHLYMLLFFL